MTRTIPDAMLRVILAAGGLWGFERFADIAARVAGIREPAHQWPGMPDRGRSRLMKAWHRPLVALGLLAPACSPGQPQPVHRATTGSTAPLHPLEPADESIQPEPVTTTTESPAPVTTVTVSKLPPTTRGTTVTTLTVRTTLPEYVDDDVSDVEWLIRQTFPETPDKAVRVARCESRLDPTAVSPDGANWGLMQVNVVHKGLAASMGYSWGQMLHAGPNLAVARAVYDRAGGWGPWSCA